MSRRRHHPHPSSRLRRFVDRHGRDPRAIPLLGAVSAGDFFLPALPTQLSVLALGWLQPRRAPWIALTFAAAAATGAGVLALLIAHAAGFAHQFGAEALGPSWPELVAKVERYGVWAVLALSMLPTPPRLATAATLLAGVPPSAVVAAVFAGKLVWFGAVLASITRAPTLLVRVPIAGPRIRASLERTGWSPPPERP